MFDIDFRYLVTILLPTKLRKERLIAFLRLINSHLKQIYSEFKNYRNLKLYDINFTGQVMYIEKKLQDMFSCSGIYIADGELIQPVYLSNIDEAHTPVYFGNLFISGTIYNTGDEIIYQNQWYSYTATGNGNTPDTDAAATAGDLLTTYMHNKEEQRLNSSFIVNIPSNCYSMMTTDDVNRLKSTVEFYKLADKSYEIKPF